MQNEPRPSGANIDMAATPGFSAWLNGIDASLIFTSYRKGELIGLGIGPDGNLSATTCGLERCMGLGVGENSLWVASAYQLWNFVNFLEPEQLHNGHDAVFMPFAANTTGAIDVHDICEDENGRPVFVVPRFNCLGQLSNNHSFEAIWKPPFISELVAEDRCHLNGLAMENGKPRYVTSISTTNESGSWRQHRINGGVVIDVPSGEIVCSNLSMPHSPRLHNGRLWLHQSGTGEFGYIEPNDGRFEPICGLPGFARGMSFYEGHALVGVSLPRADSDFDDLPISTQLKSEGINPECALIIIDLNSGKIIHRVSIGPNVDEIYDVAFLPGIRNPQFVRQQSEEIQYFIKPLDSQA